jgi:hypothetical protein
VVDPLPPVIETDWTKTVSTEKGLGGGVYAHFLHLALGGLPIGPELNAERSNKAASVFAFEKVTTLGFEPTQEYVEKAVSVPAVQTWLREPKQRFAPSVSLFLVNGIKLVKGASIKYSTSQTTSVAGNVGFDVQAIGMTIGPKGQWKSVKEDKTGFNREDEFVFAFRVKRLKFGRSVQTENYTKGAFLAIGGKEDGGDYVSVEDVDGSTLSTAAAVSDVMESSSVWCVPP